MKIAIVEVDRFKAKGKETELQKAIYEVINKYSPAHPIISGESPKGGVDIWAREYANDAGHEFIPKPPRYDIYDNEIHAFKERNWQIASECDVLYCFTVKHEGHCYHCNTNGHLVNGGCWTMRMAKELGKETHLLVL